jgi:hypothetical protein
VGRRKVLAINFPSAFRPRLPTAARNSAKKAGQAFRAAACGCRVWTPPGGIAPGLPAEEIRHAEIINAPAMNIDRWGVFSRITRSLLIAFLTCFPLPARQV